MAAFIHHCPFLKSVPMPALRRTGTALISLADRCPIIARQISVSGPPSLQTKLDVPATQPKSFWPLKVEQKRQFAQAAAQLAVSVSKSCPFVISQIGVVRASPEVQEDIEAEPKLGIDHAHHRFSFQLHQMRIRRNTKVKNPAMSCRISHSWTSAPLSQV